jgi:RNA polymerase sigma factor (TIGR02999 family)
MPTSGGTLEITKLLQLVSLGDRKALNEVVPLVYAELRQIAQRALVVDPRDRNRSLTPSDLIHETFLKLAHARHPPYQNRSHFYAIAANAIRQILVDHARKKRRQKRGGGARRVLLVDETITSVSNDQQSTVDILAIHDVLSRLSEKHPRAARVVELRFFGGLTEAECAEVLEVSERTVRNDWQFARAWLRRELADFDGE